MQVATFSPFLDFLDLASLRNYRLVSSEANQMVLRALQEHLRARGIWAQLSTWQLMLTYELITEPSTLTSLKILATIHLPIEVLAYWWWVTLDSSPKPPLRGNLWISLITGRKQVDQLGTELLADIHKYLDQYVLGSQYGYSSMRPILCRSLSGNDKTIFSERDAVIEDLALLDVLLTRNPNLDLGSVWVINPHLTKLTIRWSGENFHLYLNNGRITEVEVVGDQLPFTLDLEGNQLTQFPSINVATNVLDLSRNPLQCFELHEPLMLTQLILRECQLTQVPPSLLLYLPQLWRLNLEGNQLTELPVFPAQLKVLNVSRNRLSKLSEAFWRSLLNFDEIYLDWNQLTKIHFFATSTEKSTEFEELLLSVTGNPIQCYLLNGSEVKPTSFAYLDGKCIAISSQRKDDTSMDVQGLLNTISLFRRVLALEEP